MLRKLVVTVVGLAVLVLAPYLSYEHYNAFRFGQAEMQAAVEGTWVVELTPHQGPARSITFTIEQASAASASHSSRERGWVRSATACGGRSFVKNAEACTETSRMDLKLVAIDGDRSLALGGKLAVPGKRFEHGLLELQIGPTSAWATISSAGEVRGVNHGAGTVRLARLRPRHSAPVLSPRP